MFGVLTAHLPLASSMHLCSDVVFKPLTKEKTLAVREVRASQIGSLVQIKVGINRPRVVLSPRDNVG